MWTDGLDAWYAQAGRHHLPWRHTRDPWAVLVSEVMLQQTSVARVLSRWEDFLGRWPDPVTCAAAPLAEVLRSWDGLGYPRRARALHAAAAAIAARGWPDTEAGLRALPGIGPYTARALIAFARDGDAPPPRDVNLGRVAARAALGAEAHQRSPADLDAALETGRPATMSARDYAYALFDVGATVCLARRPRCDVCPLRRCSSRERVAAAPPPPPPGRQPAYAGSLRQLRGAVLRTMLADAPPHSLAALRQRVAHVPAASRKGAVEEALSGLRSDGLLREE